MANDTVAKVAAAVLLPSGGLAGYEIAKAAMSHPEATKTALRAVAPVSTRLGECPGSALAGNSEQSFGQCLLNGPQK